jgi:hypothetical protein
MSPALRCVSWSLHVALRQFYIYKIHAQYLAWRKVLAKVQKGVYYSGIRIYNNLPLSIRNLQNIIKFKQALKRFLLTGSFYSLNEYYEWNTRGELDSYK